jgi:hypothetical protein
MRASEYHIIILWSKGFDYIKDVKLEAEKVFSIKSHLKVKWGVDKFDSYLSRFYGDSLKRVSEKSKVCGNETFDLLVVTDENPLFGIRETSSGAKVVNINTFDFKKTCRERTSSGHLIHASDDEAEAAFQFKLIAGCTIDEYFSGVNEISSYITSDLIGGAGWDSLDDVWKVLEGCVDYIVMRNFENINNELDNDHPDIDILTSNISKFSRLLGLKKVHKDSRRSQFECLIGGKKVNFDLRAPGDGYYPTAWAYKMLKSKVNLGVISVNEPINHFWSLLYHALYHKRFVSIDYLRRLFSMHLFFLENGARKVWDREALAFEMMDYLRRISVEPCEPLDPSVYFNYYDENCKVLVKKISFNRRFRQRKYSFLSSLKSKVKFK